MIICNAFVSQLLWFRKIRTNLTSLFVISIFINIGMWFERFVIIVSSLSNDYMPWAWDQLSPTWADWGILAGSFGWFGMWFLLFAQELPDRGDPGDQGDDPDAAEAGRAPLMALPRVPACPACSPRSSTWTPRPTRSGRCGPAGTGTWWSTTAAPNHEIEEALEHPVSPVRLFTLIGGLTGCAAGFGMTIWMSLRLAGAGGRQADRARSRPTS